MASLFLYMRHIPNITVMAPKDENELRHMLKTAIACGGPAAVRYPRGQGLGVDVSEPLKIIDRGQAEVLSDGHDIAIFAIGSTVHPAMQAAQELKENGIEALVVNCRFVKPLDEKLLCSAALSTGKVITVEENVLMGGFGSAVLELFEEKGIRVIVKRLGISDEFATHATQADLRHIYGIDAGGIRAAAEKMLKVKNRRFDERKESLGP